MAMSRTEKYLWNALLLASPFLAHVAIATIWSDKTADRLAWLLAILLVGSLFLAASGRFAWMMGYMAHSSLIPVRVWLNRRWRWTMSIQPDQVAVGPDRIWISIGLTRTDRHNLGRLAEALDMLRELAPSRAARIERLGVQLAVAPIGAFAAFLPGDNVLAIDPRTLDESPGVLASVVVHELNHALVAERGLFHPLLMDRVERLAILDQYYFSYRLHVRGNREDAQRIVALLNAQPETRDTFRSRWRRMAESVDRIDAAVAEQS